MDVSFGIKYNLKIWPRASTPPSPETFNDSNGVLRQTNEARGRGKGQHSPQNIQWLEEQQIKGAMGAGTGAQPSYP